MKTDDQTLIEALRILANDIQSDDGVANACIAEGANRLAELTDLSGITDGGEEDKISYADARKYVQHYINMEMRDPCGLNKYAKVFLALVTRIAKLEDALRFYADEINYITPVGFDIAQRAREALKDA